MPLKEEAMGMVFNLKYTGTTLIIDSDDTDFSIRFSLDTGDSYSPWV